MFHHVSKHLELSLKTSAVPCFSTSVLGVWKHDETLVRVFDIFMCNLVILTIELNKSFACSHCDLHFVPMISLIFVCKGS